VKAELSKSVIKTDDNGKTFSTVKGRDGAELAENYEIMIKIPNRDSSPAQEH
jgi:hypothetical protein